MVLFCLLIQLTNLIEVLFLGVKGSPRVSRLSLICEATENNIKIKERDSAGKIKKKCNYC